MKSIKEEEISNSLLYKRNVKIHKNLWKFYGITLSASIIFVLLKGFN